MTWIQDATSSKEALEIARRLDPQARLTVTQYSPGRYLVKTDYSHIKGKGSRAIVGSKVDSYSEKITPLGEESKEIIKTGSVTQAVTVRGLSNAQKSEFEKAQAVAQETQYKDATLEDVQRQAKLLELEQREKTGKTSIIYDMIDGVQVPVQVGGVPTMYVNVDNQTIPYQDYRLMEYQKKMDNLTYDQMVKTSFGRTFNQAMTQAEIQELKTPTWGEMVDMGLKDYSVRPGHPEDIPGALVGKIGTWGVKAVTGFETTFERSTRPSTWKASALVMSSPGALKIATKEIAGEMVDYAIKKPGDFIGQMATTTALTMGASYFLPKGYSALRTKLGPTIAKATKGKIWGSQTQTFKTFKPTEYKAMDKLEIKEGTGYGYVSQTKGYSYRGNAVMKLDQFKKLIEGPKTRIQAFITGKFKGLTMRQFEGTSGTAKRTLYTYVKPKKPIYGLEFKFDTKITGTGPKTLNLYQTDNMAMGYKYGSTIPQLKELYINTKTSSVWKKGVTYEQTLYHEVLHNQFPNLADQNIRMLTGKTFGTPRAEYHMSQYTFKEKVFTGVDITKIGGRKGYVRTFTPIPQEVKIPAVGTRYTIKTLGTTGKSLEIGGFDEMIKKIPSPKIPEFKPKPFNVGGSGGSMASLDTKDFMMSGMKATTTSSGSLQLAVKTDLMTAPKIPTIAYGELTKTSIRTFPVFTIPKSEMKVAGKSGLMPLMKLDAKMDIDQKFDLDMKKLVYAEKMKTNAKSLSLATLPTMDLAMKPAQAVTFRQVLAQKQKIPEMFNIPISTTTSTRKRPFAQGVVPDDDQNFRRMIKRIGMEKKGLKINPIAELTWGPKKRGKR